MPKIAQVRYKKGNRDEELTLPYEELVGDVDEVYEKLNLLLDK